MDVNSDTANQESFHTRNAINRRVDMFISFHVIDDDLVSSRRDNTELTNLFILV